MPVGGSSGGGGPKAGDVRAGGAFVEVSLRDRLSQALVGVKKKFEAFAKTSAKIGLGAFGAGATGAAAIGKLFGAAIERGTEFQNLADKFGTSTEKISALAYAFEAAGVPVEQFGDSIKGLDKKLSMAADGQDETFRRLGLNARSLMAMPLDEQFGAIADAIAAVASPADQARFAMELFEESGLKLLPTLKKGRAGLAEMGLEAKEVGAILDGDVAKKSQEVGRTFNKAWSSIKYAALEIGSALLDNAGTIQGVSGWITKIAQNGREWISANKGVVTTVLLVTLAVAGAGAGLIALGAAASAAGAGIGAAIVIVKALVAGLMWILSPVGLITAAVIGLTALWATQTEEGRAFVERLGEDFKGLVATATECWEGIRAALSTGDLRAAAGIALAGVELVFAKAQRRILENWNDFKGFFVDGFYDAVMLIKLAWNDLDEWFSDSFLEIVKKLNDAFGGGIKKMLMGIADAIDKADVLGVMGDVTKDMRDIGSAFGSGGFSEELEKERKASKKEHDAERGKIIKDAEKDAEKRKTERSADLSEADKRIAEIQAELDAAIQSAKDKAAAQKPKAGEIQAKKALPDLDTLASNVKGGFNSTALARQFGIGDTTAKRALKAAEKTAETGEKSLKALEAIKSGLAWS